LGGEASNEVVFAVVGGAGSGTSVIAETLQDLLREAQIDSEILKESQVILQWAKKNGRPVPPSRPKTLKSVEVLEDYGDEMRAGVGLGRPDNSAVALGLIVEIQKTRAIKVGVTFEPGKEVFPNGTPRAYILDSIRHSAEVNLLRQVYGDAFVLIGVVCDQSKREQRLHQKYEDGDAGNARKFVERDNEDPDRQHGQHVADAFHLSDFFLDNTVDREITSSRAWKANEDLSRLVKIVTGSHLERPRLPETAMYHAFSTEMQSACPSRQVGAALVDRNGNIVATRANEVPRAGGGVYGESAGQEANDARCAFFENIDHRFCRNTREQNKIVGELINALDTLGVLKSTDRELLSQALRRTRIGSLLEFSRAVLGVDSLY
jgi:deoxycytidylate deaminase